MPRVIVLDNLSQTGLDLLEAAGGIEYEVKIGLKDEELRQTLLEFDGAICRSGAKITADVLKGNGRLKAIARASISNPSCPGATRRARSPFPIRDAAWVTLSTPDIARLAISQPTKPPLRSSTANVAAKVSRYFPITPSLSMSVTPICIT